MVYVLFAYNLKNHKFEHIEKELFDNKSYYVGRTSKHVPKERKGNPLNEGKD
jgi:hypothetical protein